MRGQFGQRQQHEIALFYAMMAFVVFGMIGSTIYDRLSGIKLQHGRVVSPIVEHRFGEDAFVEDILVAVGDEVQVGDLLVKLNSPRRDGALDAVRIDIRQAERRVEDAERRLLQLQDRSARHLAELERVLAAAIAARSFDDFFVGRNLEEVLSALTALRAFENVSSPLALEFEELEAQLRELLEEREMDLRQLKRDLSNAKDAYDAINIVSQVEGVVRELPLVEDLHQPRGTLAVVVEQNTLRQVVGWLDERAAQSLHVGQKALLRVATPNGTRSLDATVVDAVAGVDPARAADFGVIVTLEAAQTDLTKNRAELRPGAPVEIRADRGWALTPYIIAFRSWWS